MEEWAGEMDDGDRREYGDRAAAVRKSFNEGFWYADGGFLYDVIDTEQGGNDAKCRPNQLLAISLDHPVLEHDRWESVIRTVQQKLLTPVGLRSLAPDDPDFKPRYYGDLRTRDAAYHQGTVWGWLAGPFVDAWLKVYPDDAAGVRQALDGFVAHMDEACIGSVSEIFDAEPPFTARGCISQAWSVAELLRCWVKLSRHERAGTPLATANAASGSRT
jgi:glycogen debranching enzyme